MRHRLFSIIVLAVVLALALGGAPVAAGPRGNSVNARRCQHGGWQQLQGEDGIRFANQGDCVSHAAHGGTLEAIPAIPHLRMVQSDPTVPCSWTVTWAGFLPDTTYHYQIFLNGVSLGPGFDILTDGSGYTGSGFGMEAGNSAQFKAYLAPDLVTPVAESNVVSC